ncbi:MAG: very short patch repair endonuclease [Clostridiales Family XIII bacterium]|jgi:DNA mismatch endonuclease (patch repair protein)|nr:very short patch repair endonuclease [Clostridiales Family XIII bacterium]
MAKKIDTRTDEEKRSYTMSRIKGKATMIEVLLQKALWHRGIRYRKNYRKVTGSPDIVITKHKIAIFCDGEFWHGRDWEQKKPRLKNNRDYWVKKIERNIERDKRYTKELQDEGWHVLRFWESEIKSDVDACVNTILALMHELKHGSGYEYSIHDATPLMVAEEEKTDYSAD